MNNFHTTFDVTIGVCVGVKTRVSPSEGLSFFGAKTFSDIFLTLYIIFPCKKGQIFLNLSVQICRPNILTGHSWHFYIPWLTLDCMIPLFPDFFPKGGKPGKICEGRGSSKCILVKWFALHMKQQNSQPDKTFYGRSGCHGAREGDPSSTV